MKTLLAGLLALASCFSQITVAAPEWIEHASIPGPDFPARGISRFDQLFLQKDGTYSIPFPLSELIATLEDRVDNGPQKSVRNVFVPVGRSLQRDTPAPDYFRYPRSVLAIDGEPLTQADEAGLVMQYRLFIAHQPKSGTLEIISYNDEAGRFEFQLVENYRSNHSPRVRQANRAMCLSCHQNAAAIFPKVPWSETSFNVEIARKIINSLPQQYDSLIGLVTNDAGFIDILIERANYLSAAQRIWQQGCDSLRCRIAILRAVLQYRLSGNATFDASDRRYREHYLTELQNNWQLKWPQGLALANSRIENLDPLHSEAGTLQQDPLHARPAHANWYQADPILARGIVYRLAGFFTLADIQRIDHHLKANAQSLPIGTRRQHAKCAIESGDPQKQVLSCGSKTDNASLRARLEFEIDGAKFSSARVLRLQIAGDANIWQPQITRITESPGLITLATDASDNGLSPRLSNGDRINELNLHYDKAGDINLEIVIRAESIALAQLLASIIQVNQQGASDSLSSRPFRRQAIVTDLSRLPGFELLNWSQLSKPSPPEKQLPRFTLPGSQALLLPYCAHCHSDNSRQPPGFLSGPRPDHKIRQCAPRILARLKAWQPGHGISVSPMPPAASLGISGSSAAEWPLSDHYRELIAAIEPLLQQDFTQTRYRDLPQCLLGG